MNQRNEKPTNHCGKIQKSQSRQHFPENLWTFTDASCAENFPFTQFHWKPKRWKAVSLNVSWLMLSQRGCWFVTLIEAKNLHRTSKTNRKRFLKIFLSRLWQKGWVFFHFPILTCLRPDLCTNWISWLGLGNRVAQLLITSLTATNPALRDWNMIRA